MFLNLYFLCLIIYLGFSTTYGETKSGDYYSEPPPSISGHHKLGLLPTACGKVKNEKLLDGDETGLFEFPWMTLFAFNSSQGSRFRCGGTIINPRYILTAAHCVTNTGRATLVGVRVGEHDISKEEDCEGTICASKYQDIGIEESIPHPEYVGREQLRNDIALVRLEREIDMTADNVYPICLPTTRELQEFALENTTPTVAGWAKTPTRTENTELRKVSIPVVGNLRCGQLYNRSVSDGIGYQQLCAGGLGGVDLCSGSGGSPLMLITNVNKPPSYVQFGVVSFGATPCGLQGRPTVYTRVSYYMDWILDNLAP